MMLRRRNDRHTNNRLLACNIIGINTYGGMPEFYLDQPFTCRRCGKREIWKARDQKWYYEEAKGHIDARAVECHDCRAANKKVRGDDDPA